MRVLRYGHLYAYDAVDRSLRAHLDVITSERAPRNTEREPQSRQCVLRITLDDSQATYPITIDPLVTLPGWTAECDQAGALFGASVSTAGDVNGDGSATMQPPVVC